MKPISKQPSLGSGQRFNKLSNSLATRGVKNADALVALGRKKLGKTKFQKLKFGVKPDSKK